MRRSCTARRSYMPGPPTTPGQLAHTEVLGANTITIVAVDRTGNASGPSNADTVTTNWGPGGCGM
jgi:hypothetical protein